MEIITKDSIENAELITEENKKKIPGAFRVGADGSLLGIIGGMVELVFGARIKEICFALFSKDVRKYLITSYPKTYKKNKNIMLLTIFWREYHV
jgi:hypothetical protein